MLQFIFGLPRSGKTTYIIEKVKSLTNEGKKSVIIVPEQFSFETEKSVYDVLGDSFTLNVEILSFSRLYDEVCRVCGGTAARSLNDSDKIIFMSKALKQTAHELELCGKYAKSLTFAQKMLDTIGEFKINGITSSELSNAAALTDSINLKRKLTDLSLIYERYNLLTAERFIDPADKLTRLYQKLENYNYFADKTVFLDGFKGFTGQQFKVIDRIFTQARDVYFAFTNDNSKKSEYDIFSNIRIAISKIEQIANKHRVNINKPIVLTDTFYKNNSFNALERLLSENIEEYDCSDSITICKAKTVFDEADFAARTIRRLVRTQNLRYKDFAIIARDSDKYYQAVEYACQKNKIECFFDKRVPLLSFPLSVAVLTAIKSLDLSTENIMRFHKSGINLLSTDEITELENYAYIWNIEGDLWLKEWDMDVRGFVTDEQNDYTATSLSKINLLRVRALEPILYFKKLFYGDVSQMSSAIVKLLDNYNAKEALKEICEHFYIDEFSIDVLKQSFESFMSVLDSIVTCYNNATLSKTEYYDALYLALSLEEVGVIPQTLDQVIFGQADRIRPCSPKVVFILGANQGVFPKLCDNSGIFSLKERKNLIELNLDINDNEIYNSIDEKFFVYCNLCSASEKLYISYSDSTLKGETLEPSSFVTAIEKYLNPVICYEPSNELDETCLPETQEAAFAELCRRFNSGTDFCTLKSALDTTDNITAQITDFANNQSKSISKETALDLYSNTVKLSASKIDLFHRCRFSHFCRYGLGLKRLQPVDFDVMQRGTIVHYVLERIFVEHKDNIKVFTKEQIDTICDDYINEYLDMVGGYRSVQSARHEFLISKISRILKETVYHLSLEFAQSDFVPSHCELEIGGKEGINLNFPFDGGKVTINGKIDRVDTYNGYIRVIDYKTGSKSFKLPDILFGLNLQMLIYLYALTRGQNLPDTAAAGIFYMHPKRDLKNEGMAMDGLMPANLDLVHAMDKENEGEYIPKLYMNKDGSISKRSNSFITESEFSEIFDHIEKLIANTGETILKGDIAVSPVDGRESPACKYCDFKSICGIESRVPLKVPSLKNEEVFEIIAKEKNDGI